MDLWIRSQDGDKIIKVNSVNILAFENNINIHGYIDDKNHFWLGKYKTKERALEVLDEIQNALLNRWANNVIYENCYDDERPRNLVYEMPKE